jgi:hypothetical protein
MFTLGFEKIAIRRSTAQRAWKKAGKLGGKLYAKAKRSTSLPKADALHQEALRLNQRMMTISLRQLARDLHPSKPAWSKELKRK